MPCKHELGLGRQILTVTSRLGDVTHKRKHAGLIQNCTTTLIQNLVKTKVAEHEYRQNHHTRHMSRQI